MFKLLVLPGARRSQKTKKLGEYHNPGGRLGLNDGLSYFNLLLNPDLRTFRRCSGPEVLEPA